MKKSPEQSFYREAATVLTNWWSEITSHTKTNAIKAQEHCSYKPIPIKVVKNNVHSLLKKDVGSIAFGHAKKKNNHSNVAKASIAGNVSQKIVILTAD